MTDSVLYFDHSATTPMCPEAAEAYLRAATTDFGNPSSRHALGVEAARLLRSARADVLAALGARGGELVFTAGGTEANNLAILGHLSSKERYRDGMTVISTAGEHPSVDRPLALLEKQGHKVIRIATKEGKLDTEALRAALSPKVALVSLMLVNNETGALYDVASAFRICREVAPAAILHTDATQAFLKVPFTPESLGADLVTVSAHKVGGPKGVGALWISPSVMKTRSLVPLLHGGGQELGLRSGTENMPGILAFAAACRAVGASYAAAYREVADLRAYLIDGFRAGGGEGIALNLPVSAAPHILSVTVRGLPAETTLNFLSAKGICVSAGSACSSKDKSHGASDALLAFGLSQRDAASTVRISLAPSNTKEEADHLLDALCLSSTTLYRRFK